MSDNPYGSGQPPEPGPQDQNPGGFPPPSTPPAGSFPPPGPAGPGSSYPAPPGQGNPGYQGADGYQGYQAPGGQMPHQYPVAEPKKRRRWPWILLGVFLFLILLIGGCSFLVFRAVQAPLDATNEFVANLDDGNFDEAYESLCDSVKSQVGPDEWIAGIQSELTGEITDYSFAQVSVDSTNGVTTAEVTGTIDVDGRSRTVTYDLVEEADEWRVCNGG